MSDEAEIARLRKRLEDLEPLADAERVVARLRHDLNNPLTAIAGLAELLLMKEKTLTAEGQKRLQMIIDNCARMGKQLKEAALRKSEPVEAGARSRGACEPTRG